MLFQRTNTQQQVSFKLLFLYNVHPSTADAKQERKGFFECDVEDKPIPFCSCFLFILGQPVPREPQQASKAASYSWRFARTPCTVEKRESNEFLKNSLWSSDVASAAILSSSVEQLQPSGGLNFYLCIPQLHFRWKSNMTDLTSCLRFHPKSFCLFRSKMPNGFFLTVYDELRSAFLLPR